MKLCKSSTLVLCIATALSLSLAVDTVLAASPTPTPTPGQQFMVKGGETLTVPVACSHSNRNEVCSWVFTATSKTMQRVQGRPRPSNLVYVSDSCEAAAYDYLGDKVLWEDQVQNVVYDTTFSDVLLESESHYAGTASWSGWQVSSPPGSPSVNPGYSTWTGDLYVANAAVFYNPNTGAHRTTSINYHSWGVYDQFTSSPTVS